MAASRATGRLRTVVGCVAAVFGCEAATRRYASGRFIARVAELSTAGAVAASMASVAASFLKQARVATTVSVATAGGGASAPDIGAFMGTHASGREPLARAASCHCLSLRVHELPRSVA